jgi:hypothetical protein
MALQISCSPATNALGRPGIYLATSAAGAAIMPIAFALSVSGGAHGLVMAWWIAAPLLLAVTLAITLPVIGVRLRDLAGALLPAAASCAAMALAVTALRPQLGELAAPWQLGLLSGSGAGVYLLALWLFWPQLVRDGWAMLRRPPASAPAPGGQTTTT